MKNNLTAIIFGYMEDKKKVGACLNRIRRKLDRDPVIIYLNRDTNIFSDCSASRILSCDDILSKEDYGRINNYIYNLVESWYSRLRRLEAVTRYKDIEFGRLTELNAQKLFTRSIKNLEISLKVIREMKPRGIIFVEMEGIDSLCGLSNFLKEEFKIESSLITLAPKGSLLLSFLKKCYRFSIDLFCGLLDHLVITGAGCHKGNSDSVMIDYRLLPLIENIESDFSIFPYILETGFCARWNVLRKRRCLYLSLARFHYLTFLSNSMLFRKNKKFFKSNHRLHIKYGGFIIDTVLEGDLRKLLVNIFPYIYLNIFFMEKALKKIRPKLIVLREAVRDQEKSLATIARGLKIPTLVIQHGANNDDSRAYTRLNSDYICVWGPADKEWYNFHGNDISGVRVTGNPKYDKLKYFKPGEESKKILHSIGASGDKDTIVCLMTFIKDHISHSAYYTSDYSFMCLRSIMSAAKRHLDKQFIIKLHPFYYRGYYLDISREAVKSPNVFVVEESDLFNLFHAASLVISDMFSSAIILALILRKPVISLNLFKRNEPIPLAQRGAAIEVNNPEGLAPAIQRILYDNHVDELFRSRMDSFVYDYAYRIDGMAASRIKGFIRDLSAVSSKRDL